MSNQYKIERGISICRDKIDPNPWNPNQTNDRQQQAIEESLDRYGQIIEILVRPHPDDPDRFQVIDGAHRLDILEDRVYANIIHNLPDAEAKKLTIILNETRGEADKISLAKLLAEIAIDMPEDLGVGLPYTEDELDELIKIAAVDWDALTAFGEDDGEGEQDEGEGANEEDANFRTLFIKIPIEVMEKLEGCRDLVADDLELSSDPALMWGQVIETVLGDYLGSGGG